MAETLKLFPSFYLKTVNKEIDLNTDVIKCSLHASAMTADLNTWDYQDDLTNELSSAGGYITGGKVVSSVSAIYTKASSATAWVTGATYALGDIIKSTTDNNHVYRCIGAGTASSIEPVWTTTSQVQQPLDATVTWVEFGIGYVAVDCNDIVWTSVTTGIVDAYYGIIYDSSPGTAGTNPLIALIDFGANKTADNGGTFTVTINSNGIWCVGVSG